MVLATADRRDWLDAVRFDNKYKGIQSDNGFGICIVRSSLDLYFPDSDADNLLLGHGELFQQPDEIPGQRHGAIARSLATDDSTARNDGHITDLCIPDPMAFAGRHQRNFTTRRYAANRLTPKLIEYSLQGGSLSFRVLVVPRASRSEIVGEHNGALRVRIAAPPVDGAANDELTRILSKTFKVPRSAVQLVQGKAGRTKKVRIVGVTSDVVKVLGG